MTRTRERSSESIPQQARKMPKEKQANQASQAKRKKASPEPDVEWDDKTAKKFDNELKEIKVLACSLAAGLGWAAGRLTD